MLGPTRLTSLFAVIDSDSVAPQAPDLQYHWAMDRNSGLAWVLRVSIHFGLIDLRPFFFFKKKKKKSQIARGLFTWTFLGPHNEVIDDPLCRPERIFVPRSRVACSVVDIRLV